MSVYVNNEVVVINNIFEGKLFIYNRIKRIDYEINEDTFDIIMDIKKNKYELEQLKQEYGEDFINQLFDLEILTTTPQSDSINVKKIDKQNNVRIFTELTDKCNLKCKHCYGSFECRNSNELSLEDLKVLINNAALNGVYQFDLTGGEPFLYPHVEELLSYLYNAGMLVRIFTNLTVFDKKQLNMILKYGVKNVITSIDSSKKEVHEDFRGQIGCFDKTISSINLLKDNNVDITINTMIGNHNKDHIEEIVKFIEKMEVKSVLDVIVPEGRATELNEDILESANLIKGIYKKHYNIIDPNAISVNCGIGNRFVYLKSDGNIYICPSLISDEYKIGNIKNFDTNEIWEKLSRNFGYLSCQKYKTVCGKCKGGCRARALKLNGSIEQEDDIYCIVNEIGVLL